ncbi:hypothetical protein ABAC460_22615 [Asticcacaulis sp. AC460]|uniref:calcium-binding protein n=1 Tax=Asticcacaulis sp. AC460 TaxID=1282360 RepID=UPI0003C40ADA|nr:calcium-binding protein [Asticcacaulis sp. AC460]ESQ86722.1 hypothetical protein ABAC460_22615 [Asticcacaulis sp. AC460]
MNLIKGTKADDVLRGNDAAEQLQGEEGNDRLTGNGGNDTLSGGTGTDTADYSTSSGGVTVDLSATVPNSSGAAGNDQLSSIEVIIGSAFDDALTGDNSYQEHTRLVSSATNGGFANGSASRPSVSPDGSYIIFRSAASDIVPGDIADTGLNLTAAEDLFIRNMATGQIVRLNADVDGNRVGILTDTPLNAGKSYVFSADGQAAYFIRVDWPSDPNMDAVYSVCRKDLISGALTTVSAYAPGTDPHGATYRNISISADGGTLYYEGLYEHGLYWDYGVFSQNVASGERTLLTPPGEYGIFGGTSYTLSADGQWMTYVGVTPNLTGEGLSSTRTDMFLKNLRTGEVRLIGHSDDYFSLSWAPAPPQISSDGTKVLFVTETPNLTPDDPFGDANIFIMDVATGAITRIRSGIDNFNLEINPPVFVGATNLVAFVDRDGTVSGANTGSYDLMIYNPATGQTRTILYDLTSSQSLPQGGWGISFSDDGAIVSVNLSDSNNLPRSLIRGDTNNLSEVLVFDMATPFTTGGDDRLVGGDGNDTLSGLGGRDVLEGGRGNDVLTGGADFDRLIGGEDNDTYVVSGIHDNMGFGLSSGDDLLVDTGGTDTLLIDGTALPGDLYMVVRGDDLVVNIGRYFGEWEGGVRIAGGLFNPIERIAFSSEGAGQTLEGQGGNETLLGGSGADLLNGGAGADTMYGGGGNDVYNVDNTGDVVSEQMTAGVNDGGAYDVVYASVNYSLDVYVEHLRLMGVGHLTGAGNASDNLIVGNAGNNSLAGGAGEDVLIGADGNDTLLGDSDADVLRGGIGSDFLDGGAGEEIYDIADYSTALTGVVVHLDNTGGNTGEAAGDILFNMEGVRGGAYSDTLYASGVASHLYGEGGDDHLVSGNNTPVDQYGRPLFYELYGGDGDDFIEAGVGGDNIVGGAGKDTVSYLAAPGGIYLEVGVTDLVHPELYGYAWFDGYSSIEVFWGSEYADTIITSGDIYGFGGDDRLYGLGSDYLDGGSGADQMFGEYGNDTYVIDNAGDRILEYADSGPVDLVMASISYNLNPFVENLTLTGSGHLTGNGNGGNNVIIGNSGNDWLDGGGGNDTLSGGLGNDSFFVNAGDVVVEAAGQGVDWVVATSSYNLSANVENLLLSGSGDFTGNGNLSDNVVGGNSGNNWLDGGGGNDTLSGGLGNDSFFVNAGDVVMETAGQGSDWVVATSSYNLFANVENLLLSGSGHFVGNGNVLDNLIGGNSGNNWLDGGGGNDTLSGGQGNDSYFVNAGDVVVEAGGQGSDWIVSTGSYNLSTNVENLLLSGSGHFVGNGNVLDNLIGGNSGNNWLDGGGGNDTLNGGLGNDSFFVNAGDFVVETAGQGVDWVVATSSYNLSANVENLLLSGSGDFTGNGNVSDNVVGGNSGNNWLDGGGGNDTLNGGLGNDSFFVNAGDVVVEAAGQGGDWVVAISSYNLSANVENLLLSGSGDFTGNGNVSDNIIVGNSGRNWLDGGGGNDTLNGGFGDDSFFVSAGDVVSEMAGQGTDWVIATSTYNLSAHVENLLLAGNGNTNGGGNGLNNMITGNSGNNMLEAGAGNDTVAGGQGADVFLFATGSGADTVTDFSAAQNDSIDIHAVTNGVANAGMVTQSGANVLINLGGGNTVTVLGATQADVLSHMVW